MSAASAAAPASRCSRLEVSVRAVLLRPLLGGGRPGEEPQLRAEPGVRAPHRVGATCQVKNRGERGPHFGSGRGVTAERLRAPPCVTPSWCLPPARPARGRGLSLSRCVFRSFSKPPGSPSAPFPGEAAGARVRAATQDSSLSTPGLTKEKLRNRFWSMLLSSLRSVEDSRGRSLRNSLSKLLQSLGDFWAGGAGGTGGKRISHRPVVRAPFVVTLAALRAACQTERSHGAACGS